MIIALVIIGLGLTPPVRAAVVEWLRIGGVLIQTAPSPAGPTPTAEPPPTRGAAVTLEQAQALVPFPIGMPAGLGAPDRIEVSADRRVVSMDWTSGRARSISTSSTARWTGSSSRSRAGPFEVTAVGGRDAVWFPTAHEVIYVDRDGQQRTDAGPDRRTVPGVGAPGRSDPGHDAARGRHREGRSGRDRGIDPLTDVSPTPAAVRERSTRPAAAGPARSRRRWRPGRSAHRRTGWPAAGNRAPPRPAPAPGCGAAPPGGRPA